MEDLKPISTRIPRDIYTRLRTMAFKKNCPMQTIIIDCLRQYFKNSTPPKPLPKPQFRKDLFDQFWTAYPNKTAKQYCKKIWTKFNPDEELLQKMLEAIEWQKQSEQWREGYVPHPSTWLNQHRWKDEPKENISTYYSQKLQEEREKKWKEQEEKRKEDQKNGMTYSDWKKLKEKK